VVGNGRRRSGTAAQAKPEEENGKKGTRDVKSQAASTSLSVLGRTEPQATEAHAQSKSLGGDGSLEKTKAAGFTSEVTSSRCRLSAKWSSRFRGLGFSASPSPSLSAGADPEAHRLQEPV